MKKEWISDYHLDTGISDFIPLNDLVPHFYGKDCFCMPHIYGNVISHHSLDGREEGERVFNISCNIH